MAGESWGKCVDCLCNALIIFGAIGASPSVFAESGARAEYSTPTSSVPASKPSLSPLEEIFPMALSAEQGVAVLRYGDGQLHTVHSGQELNAPSLILRSVDRDSIVVVEHVVGKPETTARIFKPAQLGESPVIQRYSSAPSASDIHQGYSKLFVRIPLSNNAVPTVSNKVRPTSKRTAQGQGK